LTVKVAVMILWFGASNSPGIIDSLTYYLYHWMKVI